MQIQLAALRSLLKYLRERGVEVTIVLLPTSSAYDDLTVPLEFRARLETIAADDRVRFVDLSKLLNDDEYFDIHHCNYRGLSKLHEALMSLVRPQVERLLTPGR